MPIIDRMILGPVWLWALCTAATPQAAPKPEVPEVRVVYLVSKDREVQDDYTKAIEAALVDLRGWYSQQMGGITFRLHAPAVEVLHSEHDAEWFYHHENGQNPEDWGYNNALAEVSSLVHCERNDPHTTWVIYSDGPGNKGRGGAGVAVLPEDDLLGLVGRHPTQKDPKRWVAGLGHELGHAFGLGHPTDTKKDADALMWTGIYGKYPSPCYLTPEDKQRLLESPFFLGSRASSFIKEHYSYSGGDLISYVGPRKTWVEQKKGSVIANHFEEVERDAKFILLEDRSRALFLRLPLRSGTAEISTDQRGSWKAFTKVKRAK